MSRADDKREREYLRLAPKVELHVHLEGAMTPRRLARLLSGAPHAGFNDFAGFLTHFRAAVAGLQTVEEVRAVALDCFRLLARDRVLYAEVIFAAPIFTRAGLPLAELLEAVVSAEAEVLRASPPSPAGPFRPRYNLMIDLVRNYGPAAARAQVESLAKLAHPRVVGIHLGGDEVAFPARDFAAAYAAAREAGLGLAAHAGEAAPAGSVRDAVEVLGVRRVGHGIRSIEDPCLVERLIRRRVTLEVCPTSNLRTGVVRNAAAHPLVALVRRGVQVAIGSDDPAFFGTSPGLELARARSLGLSLAEIDGAVDAAARAAFLPPRARAKLTAAIRTARSLARRESGL